MRINPAFSAIPRVATEDFTFQGLDIPTGTYLMLCTAAANAEPGIFGDAPFDITAHRPTQLTFGAGIHYCLGAGLARAQMSEALPILASRLGDITLTGPLHLRPHRSHHLASALQLNIVVSAAFSTTSYHIADRRAARRSAMSTLSWIENGSHALDSLSQIVGLANAFQAVTTSVPSLSRKISAPVE